MLSYQHAYHAGNFADVHKHLALFAIIEHLLRKRSAVTYIDTHAGRGLYPLTSGESLRLQEYRQGVAPLWRSRESLAADPLLREWLAALAEVQGSEGAEPDHYPGSPWWLAHRLRAQDRLVLFELHPGEHGHLQRLPLAANARHLHGDGLKGLLERLPVSTPRLCVLVDPSYERKAEYGEVVETLLEATRKARHGVMLVWYPLLAAGRHHALLEGLRTGGLRKIWRSELVVRQPAAGEHGMYGSGLLVVNPPWGLEQRLDAALAAVTPLLGRGASHRSDWWVAE